MSNYSSKLNDCAPHLAALVVDKACAPYSDSFSELTEALQDLGTFQPVAERC